MTQDIPVTYVGKVHESFYDRLYGSGLTFARGQTRSVPALLAKSLLMHASEFEIADVKEPTKAKGKGEDKDKEPPVDDTKEVLEAKKKADEKEREIVDERQGVVDSIHTMDKSAVQDFAKEKYGQTIPKTLSLENMRVKAVGLIDQYGLV